jgi:cell wall-active antibiotic response 4TMS protein YvqF
MLWQLKEMETSAGTKPGNCQSAFHSPTITPRLPINIIFLPNISFARYLLYILLGSKLKYMQDQEYYKEGFKEYYKDSFKQYAERRHKSRLFIGVAIAVTGLAFLLTSMGLLPCISLDISWPYILIGIGVLIGIKNGFHNNAWWILIVIGIANLTPPFTIMGRPSTRFAWPAAIIVAGLAIAFRPHRDRCFSRHGRRYGANMGMSMDTTINNDSTLSIDVTFGGKKEVVTSKDFKGGTVSATFAGCEINLAQADIMDPSAILDCRVSFGSLEMVIPSHWEIQNEINPSFGNVEDSRTIHTATTNETRKILILRGNCSFGSIEIKSY